MTPRIAIIGGGLSGMAAAHRLLELAPAGSMEIDLFEAGARLGGLVGTERVGDDWFDLGADSFITNKHAALDLCRRLGLSEQLQGLCPAHRGALVLRNGRPYSVPDGFQLMTPSAVWPILATPILSWSGKLRLLGEYFVPKRPLAAGDDESLASFVTRRFGREALERLVQPLVGGIYTADPANLSLAATLPRFIDQEQSHGSLIRAAWSELRSREPPSSNKPTAVGQFVASDGPAAGARYGLFAALRPGMQSLADALSNVLSARCRIRLGAAVASVAPAASRFELRWTRAAMQPDSSPAPSSAMTETYDAVIVATSAYRAAEILADSNSAAASDLSGIEYASTTIVVSAHRPQDVAHPLNAYGLVVPALERRKILAVSFASRKFPERSPVGNVQLRTFVGGAMQPELAQLPDAEMLETVLRELRELLGVAGTPVYTRIARWNRSMPQYHVGHLARARRIEAALANWPRLRLAGNALHGVGVPDTIASGEDAADAIWASLTAP